MMELHTVVKQLLDPQLIPAMPEIEAIGLANPYTRIRVLRCTA